MQRWGTGLTQAAIILCLVSLASSCTRARPPAARTTTARKPSAKPPAPADRPPAEIRAVWVSNTDKLDWDTASANLQRAGYNTMYVNFASSGAAFYPSALVPNVQPNNTDPLATGIPLARRRGLAVHAKFIVTFLFKTTTTYQTNLRVANRVMRGADGRPIEQSGSYWLCPSQATNRQLAISLVTEMLTRYPVDGLQLDYIRFNENPSCFCSHCRQEFERATNTRGARWPQDVLTGPLASRFHQWRIAVINDWMHDIAAAARRVRPGIILNAAVFPDLQRACEEKGQDWRAWLQRGDIHYVCIMNYTTDPAAFLQRLQDSQFDAGTRSKVVVGIGSWKFTRLDLLIAQLKTCRQQGAPGFALFSYDDCAARDFLPQFVVK